MENYKLRELTRVQEIGAIECKLFNKIREEQKYVELGYPSCQTPISKEVNNLQFLYSVIFLK